MSDHVLIRVVIERTYVVPMVSKNRTAINGWTAKQVEKSWFHDFSISEHHATRDTYRLGGSDRLLSTEIIVPEPEFIHFRPGE